MIIRMQEFNDNDSIAESMGVLFGKSVRIVTALSGILFSLGAVSIQIRITANILAMCCDIQNHSLMVIATLIVLIYSSFGGISP